VSGRKIAGLGAGAVGNAEVLVGNFLFDFDAGIMSKALRVSNEKFRDKIRESMQEYITTTKKELGRIPDIETVKQTYIRRCKDTLGERLEIGTFTDSELRTLEKTEARLDSVSWLSQEGALIRSGIKIHSDVWLYQTNYSTPGAQVYATLRVKEDRIDDVSLSGDFQFHPESKLREFENFLLNRKLSNAGLLAAIESFYQAEGIHSPGLQAQDWVRALLMHKAPEYRV
jgi:lipoate-protein ligase A